MRDPSLTPPRAAQQPDPGEALPVVVDPGAVHHERMRREAGLPAKPADPGDRALDGLGGRGRVARRRAVAAGWLSKQAVVSGSGRASGSGARTAPSSVPVSSMATEAKASLECLPGTGPSTSRSVTTQRAWRMTAQPFFGRSPTGPPAACQPLKPSEMWETRSRPISCAVLAASAERHPEAQ